MNSEAKDKKKTSGYFYYITVLTVLSAIAVIILHANGGFWSYRSKPTWLANDILESVFYFAVPIFFMITGATLMDYKDRYGTKTFFKRRFKKTLLSFLFWSAFALFFYEVIRGQSQNTSIPGLINGIFFGGYLSVFWFFPPLFLIYLAMPLFASIKKTEKKRVLTYLAIILIIINSLIPFILSILSRFAKVNISWPYQISAPISYFIYPILGYVLHNREFNKKQRIIIYILAFVGLMTHLLGTYFLSNSVGAIDKTFKGYTNFPTILYSTGVFVLIKQTADSKLFQKLSKPINLLAKYTFAFYLTHFFVMKELSDFLSLIGIKSQSIFQIPVLIILTPICCMFITYLLRKIPYVKEYILP